jgi:predicted transcriptional regulator YdeE
MPRWSIEVIHEPTGQYMNFEADTDTDDINEVYKEILNNLSIVPLERIDDELDTANVI